ncbi:MAG: dUTP diphosphatase [bacterium]|nr:dUTP diphosphatase [bacterium]
MHRPQLKIQFLRHGQGLPVPQYQTSGASGMDLYAAVGEPVILQPGEIRCIPSGIAVEIEPGYEAQVRARSGLALKHGIGLVNAPGTIDADYRGEVGLIMINHGRLAFTVERGMRIAQMVIQPVCQAELVVQDELTATARAAGGFGHTGHD